MRRITPGEGSTIQLTDEDYLAAVRPLTPTDERTVGRPLTRPRPLDERTLIDELCRVSLVRKLDAYPRSRAERRMYRHGH